LFVLGDKSNIYRSVNGGTEWEKMQVQPLDLAILDISFVNMNLGYAGGTGGAIFTTTDGGRVWSHHSTVGNLWWSDINFIDSLTGFISGDDGVWRTTTGGTSSVSIDAGNTVVAHIRPNPANARFTLEYSLKSPESICVSVLDMSGREVLKFANQHRQPGMNSQLISVEHLPAASYICQISASTFVEAIPFTIAR
jgi:hypothetical protein